MTGRTSIGPRIDDAGDYVVLGVDADPDRPLTGGFVARDDENFIFVSGVAGECPGETGYMGQPSTVRSSP